jgi:hypothetical protein
VDPVTQRRVLKDSAQFYRAVALANAIGDDVPAIRAAPAAAATP